MTAMAAPARLRIRVSGCVQGVGFRPHVARLARRMALTGFARNDQNGLLIEVQGRDPERLLASLTASPPPLARITSLSSAALIPCPGERDFALAPSEAAGPARAALPPDVAICVDCLEEVCAATGRRAGYPFTTCTACGPRFTIAAALPYDRARTSLGGFPLCPDCAAEYANPEDRRYHAEALACPACGPRLSVPIASILATIAAGGIVAIKGLGGFNLVCDARAEPAVARLRARKERGGKPFAVMVANLASARALAALCPVEAAALTGADRPIVLARARPGLAPSVAPGLATIGLMLPAAPLHYLLFHAAAGRPPGTAWLDRRQSLALVVTSANPGGEPILADAESLGRALPGIADLIADHDRPILARADDSVVRVIAGAPRLLRRARGHVPRAIALAHDVPPVLAVGAGQKVALCQTRGAEAVLSQHIGDPDSPAALDFLEGAAAHLRTLLATAPVAVAHDLHPDLPTTRFARALGLPTIAVQHHHAHAAAVLAEHRHTGPALAAVLDGYGYGADGGAWGGELLRLDGPRMTRLGHLAPLPLPGGDAANTAPWRMAASVLHALGRGAEIPARFARFPQAVAVARLCAAPRTGRSTACGRYFDAAAALAGLAPEGGFEARAAMLLEQHCAEPRCMPDAWRIEGHVLGLLPLFARIADLPAAELSACFHGTLAAALADWLAGAARATGIKTIALGGGCLANRVLAETLGTRLHDAGLVPLLPLAAPCNDGGLALGQAWVAAQLLGGP